MIGDSAVSIAPRWSIDSACANTANGREERSTVRDETDVSGDVWLGDFCCGLIRGEHIGQRAEHLVGQVLHHLQPRAMSLGATCPRKNSSPLDAGGSAEGDDADVVRLLAVAAVANLEGHA